MYDVDVYLLDESGCLWPKTLVTVVLLNGKQKGRYVAPGRWEDICFLVGRILLRLAPVPFVPLMSRKHP
jgi:hypothetical protein